MDNNQIIQIETKEDSMTKVVHAQKSDFLELVSSIDTKPYYEDKEREIVLYNGDSLKILPLIKDNSIDMIFADPPYFLSNGG